eukprot:3933378-Prymnesium_polylepis.1
MYSSVGWSRCGLRVRSGPITCCVLAWVAGVSASAFAARRAKVHGSRDRGEKKLLVMRQHIM